MSVQSQRGRKVETRKRNPVTIFYLVIGAILLIGIAFLATILIRGSNVEVSAPNAPITIPLACSYEWFFLGGP